MVDTCTIQVRRRMKQLELRPRTWGGRRDGAGRKPNPGRRPMSHRRRPAHEPRCPAHVTLRAGTDVPSLRDERLLRSLQSTFLAASNVGFRIVAFSIQKDHLHLLAEADEPTGFVPGVQGLAIRVAKAINRELGRRGRVWHERYHAHHLRSPKEVRNALVYVLNNFRKHIRGARGLDPYSSARWFGGWRSPVARVDGSSPIAAARTWLARVGWLRGGGPIDPEESPRADSRRRRCDDG